MSDHTPPEDTVDAITEQIAEHIEGVGLVNAHYRWCDLPEDHPQRELRRERARQSIRAVLTAAHEAGTIVWLSELDEHSTRHALAWEAQHVRADAAEKTLDEAVALLGRSIVVVLDAIHDLTTEATDEDREESRIVYQEYVDSVDAFLAHRDV